MSNWFILVYIFSRPFFQRYGLTRYTLHFVYVCLNQSANSFGYLSRFRLRGGRYGYVRVISL